MCSNLTPMGRWVSVWALLALVACGGGEPEEAPAPPAEDPPPPGVTITLDGEHLTRVALADLGTEPRSLVDLLAGAAGEPEAWVWVEGVGPDDRTMRVHQPLQLQPHKDLGLSLDAAGDAMLTHYPRTAPTQATLRLAPLERVRVLTAEPEPEPEREVLVVTVTVGAGEPFPLTDERLEGLTVFERTRGGDGSVGEEGDGAQRGPNDPRRRYHLADFAAELAGVESVAAVRLTNKDGTHEVGTEILSLRDLHAPVIKRNRRGWWHFERIDEAGQTLSQREISAVGVVLP